jgi:DNA-binding response OmpR family regulator
VSDRRRLLTFGQLRAEHRAVVEAAVLEAKLDVVFVVTPEEANRFLETSDDVLLLVQTTSLGAEDVCRRLRASGAHQDAPIVAMSRELSDLPYAKAYSWGVDDVVRLGELAPLTQRLTELGTVRRSDSQRPPALNGEALVADSDTTRCTALGRALSGAGFMVRYAGDARTAEFYACQEAVKLVVLHPELGDTRPLIKKVQNVSPNTAWVITVPEADIPKWKQTTFDLPMVGIVNSAGPAENAVYFAHALLNHDTADVRSRARSLHGTTVAFRAAGDDADEIGFTYNVSATGLYIRTLCPPSVEKLWLELRPPKRKALVRLLGQITWRRPYGATDGDGTPPGFAVTFLDGLDQDLQAWKTACEKLSGAVSIANVPNSAAGLDIRLAPEREQAAPLAAEPPPQSAPLELGQILDDALSGIATDEGIAPVHMGLGENAPVVSRLSQAPLSAETETSSDDADERLSNTGPDDSVLDDSLDRSSELEATPAQGAVDGVSVEAPAKNANAKRWAIVAGAVALALAAAGVSASVLLADPPVAEAPRAPPPVTPSTAPAPTPGAANPEQVTLPAASSDPDKSGAAPGSAPSPKSALPLDSSGGAAPTLEGEEPEVTDPPEPLAANTAQLVVRSSVSARVFIHGVDSGTTNTPLASNCGARLVRLANDSGEFLEPGQSVALTCGKRTTLVIEPKAAP